MGKVFAWMGVYCMQTHETDGCIFEQPNEQHSFFSRGVAVIS